MCLLCVCAQSCPLCLTVKALLHLLDDIRLALTLRKQQSSIFFLPCGVNLFICMRLYKYKTLAFMIHFPSFCPLQSQCGEIVNPSVDILKGCTKEVPVGECPHIKTTASHSSQTVLCKMHIHCLLVKHFMSQLAYFYDTLIEKLLNLQLVNF